MGVSKVNFGNQTLIDLTSDTVTAESLAEGVTAHGADGEPIRGTGTLGSDKFYSIEDTASNSIDNADYIPFYDTSGTQKTKILFSVLKALIDTDTKDWASITGKPTTFPPSSHTHSWDSITGKPSSFTPASHTHAWSEITGKPSTFAPSSHDHNRVQDAGDGTKFASFAFSKAGLNYGDYTWLAGWNGYELRAINKNQFAQASHTHTPGQIVLGNYGQSSGTDGITASKIGRSASNKTFGLPAAAITIEYSTDGGSTWVDYGASNDTKRDLFNEIGTTLYLGKASAKANNSVNNRLRVTIEPTDRYVSVHGCYIWMSTNGNTVYYNMERSTIGAKDTFTTVFTGQRLDGWSGANIRYFDYGQFGGGSDQTGNKYKYRMTFYMTAINANYPSAIIQDIRFIGDNVWSSPNNMVSRNRMYSWDRDFNVSFPANLTVPGTLYLTKMQDASGGSDQRPALVIGTVSGEHIEIDSNEIMAKYSGTTTSNLYLNSDGGIVYANLSPVGRVKGTITSGQVMVSDGTDGGMKTSGYTIAKSVPADANFSNTWRGIQNNLTSDSTTDSLSAAQGKALKALIDGKTSNTGTVTSIAAGTGLTGGTITGSGTLKANLKTFDPWTNEAKYNSDGNASKLYAVGVDKNGNLAVAVPWTDSNTWRGIQDNLTSDSTTDSLSAKQGKNLANGSARDSTKLPLAGGTLTGVVTSTYTSSTYVNSLTKTAFRVTPSSFGGWISGTTKNGNITIATYPASDNKIYFGYGESGRTANSYAKQMTWDGSTGNLEVTSINGYTIAKSVPSNAVFTDTNVKQGSTNTLNWRKVVLGYQDGSAGAAVTEQTKQVYVTPNIEAQSQTGFLRFKGMSPLITGSGTAGQDKGSGVSPRYFPAKWTFNLGRDAADGDVIYIKAPVAGHAAGVFISIDNGSHYRPICTNAKNRLTTHYPVGHMIMLMYDAAAVTSTFALAGSNGVSDITGSWRVVNYYDSGNTTYSITTWSGGNGPTVSSFVQNTAKGTLMSIFRFRDDKNMFGLGTSGWVKGWVIYQNAHNSAYDVEGFGMVWSNSKGEKRYRFHVGGQEKNSSAYYINRVFQEVLPEITPTLTKTLSTSASTTFTFSNSLITTSSTVDVYTSIWGVNPTSVTVAAGSVSVVIPKYTSAASLTVKLHVYNY